jgi:hypothetical protein
MTEPSRLRAGDDQPPAIAVEVVPVAQYLGAHPARTASLVSDSGTRGCHPEAVGVLGAETAAARNQTAGGALWASGNHMSEANLVSSATMLEGEMEMDTTPRKMPARSKSFWTRWRLGHTLATGVLALVLVGFFAAPAQAQVQVLISGVFGPPSAAYSYVTTFPYVSGYPYGYAAPCYPRYPVYAGYTVLAPPVVPRRAWARGHWAWRGGPRNRDVRVRVPSHLR